MATKRRTKAQDPDPGGESRSPERDLSDGEILYDVGETSRTAYFIRSGEIDLLSPNGAGVFRIAERLGPGRCLGGVEVLTGSARTYQARAATEGSVVEVDAETFRLMCSERPAIALRILEQHARRSDDLERRLCAIGAEDLIRPIVFALLSAAEQAERGVRVATTLRELSAQSGLSMRETHRGLQTLFEAKEVRIHDDALWIPEPDALRTHLQGTALDAALP